MNVLSWIGLSFAIASALLLATRHILVLIERARRRANIRKMSTRRLLDALENPGKVSSSDWDMMIRLAVKRGVVETTRFAARYVANAKVAKEAALGEKTC